MPCWFRSQKFKDQYHNKLITENSFCRITVFPLRLLSWNFTHRLTMSGAINLLIWKKTRSKVKVKIHYLNRFRCITALPFHLSSWNFTHILCEPDICSITLCIKTPRSQCNIAKHVWAVVMYWLSSGLQNKGSGFESGTPAISFFLVAIWLLKTIRSNNPPPPQKKNVACSIHEFISDGNSCYHRQFYISENGRGF